MHAVAFRVRHTARRTISRRGCRIAGNVRWQLPTRHFHRSAISYRTPDNPSLTDTERGDERSSETEHLPEQDKVGDIAADRSIEPVEGDTLTLSPKARQGKSGSGRIRANRQRQPEGLPPVVLPDWFWSQNVKCVGGLDLCGSLAVCGGDVNNTVNAVVDTQTAEVTEDPLSISASELTRTTGAKYSIHADVYAEILSSLGAALTLRPPRNSGNIPPRPLTLLQCPRDGGTYYLDSVVETIATKLGADLVLLDAQDIAQIVGSYVDENLAWTRSKTATLGYETQKAAGILEDYDKDADIRRDNHEQHEDDEDVMSIPKGNMFSSSNMTDFQKRLASLFDAGRAELKGSASFESSKGPTLVELVSLRSEHNAQAPAKPGSDQWNDLKVTTVLEALIGAADSKRASTFVKSGGSTPLNSDSLARDVIIQVKEYKDLRATARGAELLGRLQTAVNKRWYDGRNIILVGTTSSEEQEQVFSRSEINNLQFNSRDSEQRTILVPPDRREKQSSTFESDERDRIRRINVRHIEDMIIKLADGNQHLPLSVDIEKNLDNAAAYSAGLEDAVWTYPRVHRLATTILGSEKSLTSIDGPIIGKALKLLAASDEVKFSWGAMELKREDSKVETMLDELNETTSSKNISMEKLRHIRKSCTTHEKKLLGGVIIPSDIKTTFADVHAPKETIEALKMLTSLSLIRPEAFSYGVLATDKIPGLLLYGPPGTGKTLLAKAVAKESGATVLEVSGAEVNDMFVGEGEKNVKAIFTLAKKLSPCIVFIDEADAIFAARGEAKRTGTHRELINQFLREWDGMNDLTAFIMVATNRPFDLDEAVLRRLPRRLLVDLPVEKDRESILKIHLENEILDESVSLARLAKDTPFYSGSDLKNLSVAAALACVREENEIAARHGGDEPYVYPERRILTKQHFEKAMGEISASISEDMSTLAAIRKFDEKYGDRKGRRKKTTALGFGGTAVPEKDSEAARVRKIEAA